jgi:hypothetical protein
LINAEAWSVLSLGMPSPDVTVIDRKISGISRPSGMRKGAKNHKSRSPYALVRSAPDDEHHCHGDEAARREDEAGPGGRVAENLLHQLVSNGLTRPVERRIQSERGWPRSPPAAGSWDWSSSAPRSR